ncbi:T9SS type A sorting domain-containing protein [Marinigracilibium pacificum]|uniref:T9SS type A sorting domain-containing protein n=1 Tax=Marinigracilibium pacificum TaxID=2729599 RepID=A0A848IYS7_9BACT|nr:T9SS type A sorting domain-containing protein [Marinigracilibium pacificum]NMM47440.1 T9SS type A sorting domain-containing protein [Marinigracilibium pacificum]
MMKNKPTTKISKGIILSAFLFFSLSISGYSQCTPTDCLSTLPPYGGVCDSSFVDGNLNQAYSDFESFHITTACFDAGELDPGLSGYNIIVDRIDNFMFDGLPAGLSATTDQDFYTSPGNGCISISGTPTEAGQFAIIVGLQADVTLNNSTCDIPTAAQNDNQISLPLKIVILPNASFTIPETSFSICADAVTLTTTGTTGGTFSGPGVTNNTFDPSVAGVGTHTLTYTVSSQQGNAIAPASNSSTIEVTVTDTPVMGTDTQSACDSFTWIDGNTYTESNNTATFNIEGGAANGCDSLVTLNLTINKVTDLTTSTDGSTITVNNDNATVQWLDCGNNYSIIPDETNKSFTPESSGMYAAELTENGCKDTTSCVEVNPLGILENDFGTDLIVYPNPTEGNFSIDMGSYYKEVEITVFNIEGKLITREKFRKQQTIGLNIQGNSGVYLIGIDADNKKAKIRILKK